MNKFHFEIPDICRKDAVIAYINEFHEYGSDINGTGGLHKFLDDYEGWLDKLEKEAHRIYHS